MLTVSALVMVTALAMAMGMVMAMAMVMAQVAVWWLAVTTGMCTPSARCMGWCCGALA